MQGYRTSSTPPALLAALSRRSLLKGTAGLPLIAAFPAHGSAGAYRATVGPPLPDPIAAGAAVYDVGPAGYIAEEYLLSGYADVLEPVTMADARPGVKRDNLADFARRGFERTIVRHDAPYTTRIVIYRPKEPARVSGNIVVEITHPAGGGSLAIWSRMNDVFIANGDIHLSVQSPGTFAALKAASPIRYGQLDCADPTQIWGMVSDAGRLVRSSLAINPLRGARMRRLYLTGYSFTAIAAATFANFHHENARMPDGKPIFDGYLPISSPIWMRDLDVPMLRINTQSDFDSFGGIENRKSDSADRQGLYRLYEVGGAAHVRNERVWPGLVAPPPPLVPPTASNGAGESTCKAAFPRGAQTNDFPLHHYAAAAFSNLYAWVDKGIPPPSSALLATDAKGQVLTDRFGNAQGGLRSSELDVPVAHYGTGSTPDCRLVGYTVPFTSGELTALYGTKDRYHEAVDRHVSRLLASGLLRKREAAFVKEDARKIAFEQQNPI